jgi:serine phosphatase RsbU (regulator of sigma subunit)
MSNLRKVRPSKQKSAQIVQQGLLPKARHFDRNFDRSFVIYLPQNIISGDFYWVGKSKGLKYIAVGDCTGHGVSGALLSVLGLNLLEYAVMNKGIKKTSKILKELDTRFLESFQSYSTDKFDNPWIDISLVCIDEKEQKVYYAGGNRKILAVSQSGTSNLYTSNRYPIGGWQIEKNRKFESQSFSYQKGDRLFIGSDGIQDQIGGLKNKKFKSRQLHTILTDSSQLTMAQQKDFVLQKFNEWKGKSDQTDDVCLVGIEL